MNNLLETEIIPEWKEIDIVRNDIDKFLNEKQHNPDVIHSIQMVSSELLENAVKYGEFKSGQKISFSLTIEEKRMTIEVKSPLHDNEERHLDRLDSQIQWIRGYQNPFEAYVEKLKEVSSKELEDGESGLGLVRIAYEGQSILDFFINEENILAVNAVYEYKNN